MSPVVVNHHQYLDWRQSAHEVSVYYFDSRQIGPESLMMNDYECILGSKSIALRENGFQLALNMCSTNWPPDLPFCKY